MKKFIKVCLIGSCILIAAGTAVTTAAFVLGANPVRIARYSEQRFNFLDDVDAEFYTVPAEPVDEIEATYPVVAELEICQAGGSVRIYPSEVLEELVVKSNGASLEDQKYDWSDEKKSLSIDIRKDTEYEIHIPSKWTLRSLEVDVAGGAFSADGIRAEAAEYNVAGGKIQAVQDYGKDVELNAAAGSISWETAGEMAEVLEADCQAGSIVIGLPDSVDPSELHYELDCQAGAIKLPTENHKGIVEKNISGKDGAPRLSLDCQAGSITVKQ